MLNKKLVVLALILSLSAAGSVYWYLTTIGSRMDTSEKVAAVVAAVDIPKNTVIKEEMLTETELPKAYSQAGGVTQIEEVVGNVANTKIFRGQQVLSKAFIESGDKKAGLAYTVPIGRRAVSVPVNEVSGLDGQLLPGDRVDVAATLDFEVTGGSAEINQTSIILQNIQVLAVGRVLEAEAQNWIQREGLEKTVTLAVTPQEAQPLIMASEKGTIRMLLRSPADDEILKVPALRGTDMLQGR